MSPIKIPLPSGENSCYPTTSQDVIVCYSNNNVTRSTYKFDYEVNGNTNNYWRRISVDNNYNYVAYNPTGIPYNGSIQMFPELTSFWFPLISCICVGFIFFFVYRLLFRRFIK